MKKKLDETSIANELRGASLFFQKPADGEEKGAEKGAAQEVDEVAAKSTPQAKPRRRKTAPKGTAASNSSTTEVNTAVETKIVETASEPEQREGTAAASVGRSPLPERAQLVETIRKNVKQLGKESAFCRFTVEEKSALGDIVYHYKRNGVRTSENEVVRIAVNWLLENHRNDAKNSMLATVLASLNA